MKIIAVESVYGMTEKRENAALHLVTIMNVASCPVPRNPFSRTEHSLVCRFPYLISLYQFFFYFFFI